MSYLLQTDDGIIVGRFASLTEAQNTSLGLNTPTRVNIIHPSEVIGCDKNSGYDSVFCVIIGCQNVWVEALDVADAVVTAAKICSSFDVGQKVLEYSLPREKKNEKVIPAEISIPKFVLPLLERLNDFNIDLVSLALSYSLTVEDVADMEKWEILGIGEEEYCPPLLLTSLELRQRVKVWHFPAFIEETDASREVYLLYRRAEMIENTEELLCLSYLFEVWAHCGCTYPYSLFNLLLEGRLDPTLRSLSNERKILFG